MFQNKKAALFYTLSVTLIAALLVTAIIYAWTEPTTTPPGGNVPAPINVSGNSQTFTDSKTLKVKDEGVGILSLQGGLWTQGIGIFDGNVGIGTTSPSEKLDIVGNLEVNGVIYGQRTTKTGDVLIIGNDTKLVDINVANTVGLYGIQDNTIASIKLGSGGGTISGYNGNVGIGTTSPQYKLDVQGGQINASGGLCIAGVCKTTWGELTGYWSQSGSNLYPNNTGWNVGIGTTNPTAKLTVLNNVTSQPYAILARSNFEPTASTESIAVGGATYDFVSGSSGAIGILGRAWRNPDNSISRIAVSGYVYSPKDYAGYFRGKVGIEGDMVVRSIEFGSLNVLFNDDKSGSMHAFAQPRYLRRLTTDNNYPSFCGKGAPNDAWGRPSPQWDNKTLPFYRTFVWGIDPIDSAGYPNNSYGRGSVTAYSLYYPSQNVDVLPGDLIAYYYTHSGDYYHCSYNITTGQWVNISKCGEGPDHRRSVIHVNCGESTP